MHLPKSLLPLIATAALIAGCTTHEASPTTPPTPTLTPEISHTMTAQQILAAASAALKESRSVHLKGKGMTDGTPVEVDAVYAGNTIKGWFVLGALSFELIEVSNQAYIKAGSDFWKAQLPTDLQAQALPNLTGKYGQLPLTDSIVPKLPDFLNPKGEPTKDQITTIDGSPVIGVRTSNGQIEVSLLGRAYPVEIDNGSETLSFLDIDANVTVDAPSPSEIFDLSPFRH
jgi:hypothetical protein